MRQRRDICRSGSKTRHTVLRMQKETVYIRKKTNSWDESSSCMGSVAFYETAVHGFESSCIQKLWRSWNNCLSEMDGEFREFLGSKERKLSQQTDNEIPGNKVLEDTTGCSCRNDRLKREYVTVSDRPRVADRIAVSETGLSERVYDIRNCGPRNRFVVLDNNKLRIVSNCTQAVARDILMFAMKSMRDYKIVAHVHDEVIIECPEDVSVDTICQLMARTPSWAEGLQLKAEGYEGKFYKK